MRACLRPCFIVFAAYLAAGTAEETVQPKADPVMSLQSPKMSDRANAYSELRRQRIELVRALMHVVGSASDKYSTSEDLSQRCRSPKYLAILVLGELRAGEAARLLARNITWRVRPRYGGTNARLVPGQFPAAESLARIGGPAVSAVLGILHRTASPVKRHLCVWTLIAIDGRDVARFRVQNAIEQSRLSGVKALLEEALEYYEKEDIYRPPPEESEDAEGE